MPERPKKPTRRERERLRHREEILEAAREVLAKRGLDGLTIEEIAKEAEFAVGSIYRYFGSKEDLLDVLLVDLASPFLEEVEALVVEEVPFEQALERLLVAFATHAAEGMPALQLLHALPSGARVVRVDTRRRLREAGRRYVEDVRALVEQGQAQGVLVAEDPGVMAVCLVGMASIFARRAAYGIETDLDAAMRLVRRAFLDGYRDRATG